MNCIFGDTRGSKKVLTAIGLLIGSSLVSSAASAQEVAPALAESTTSALPSPSSAQDLLTTETKSIVNRPLFITSALLFAGTYGTSIGFAATSDRPENRPNLYYPLAGPWMAYNDKDCASRACSNETIDRALLIADGIGQGLGVLGMMTSFLIPEKTTRHWYLIGGNSSFQGGPARVGTGYGIGAVGSF